MSAFAMRLNEIRLAADLLARAEAWVEQGAPELQADIARIRARLLVQADRLMDWPAAGVRPTVGEERVRAQRIRAVVLATPICP